MAGAGAEICCRLEVNSVCVCVCVCVCVFMGVCVHALMCLSLCVRACLYVHVCVRDMHTYVQRHIHNHAHPCVQVSEMESYLKELESAKTSITGTKVVREGVCEWLTACNSLCKGSCAERPLQQNPRSLTLTALRRPPCKPRAFANPHYPERRQRL